MTKYLISFPGEAMVVPEEDFEAVVGIEFAPEHADLILAEHPDATGVDYAVTLGHRRF